MHARLATFAMAVATTIVLPAPRHVVIAQQTTTNPAPSGAVTIEGCLQEADHSGSLGGTPHGNNASPLNAGDVANNPEPPLLFVLADARPVAPSTTVGTSGTAATTRNADGTVTREDARQAPKTYALVGSSEVLARFKGTRVEVEGTLAPPVRVRANQTGTDPQAADVGAQGGAAAPPVDNSRGTGAFDSNTERLTVTRVRPKSDSCTPRR